MEILIQILAFVSPPLMYLVGYFFGGKKKANAESIGIEMANMTAVIQEWKNLNVQLKNELQEAQTEYKEHLKVCNGTKPQ